MNITRLTINACQHVNQRTKELLLLGELTANNSDCVELSDHSYKAFLISIQNLKQAVERLEKVSTKPDSNLIVPLEN